MLENKRSKKREKSQLLRFNVGSGCVLGGVVLLGGGLAVAGLVAAFTIIKSRNRDQKNDDPAPAEKIHDGTQGLGSVLQNPTTAVHQNSCYTNHTTPTIGVSGTDSRELISAHNMDLVNSNIFTTKKLNYELIRLCGSKSTKLIGVLNNLVQGVKSVPIMDGVKEDLSRYQQEILLNKESIEPSNEILNNEDTSLPAPEIIIKNDSGENLQLIQNIEMKKEDEPAETEEEDDGGSEELVMDKEEVSQEGAIATKAMQPVEEEDEKKSDKEDENLSIQPVVEEEEENDKRDNDDSGEEDVTEKEEESSEGTGSSSRESNVEAIWPTDMIEALSHELKVINASNQNSVEKMAKTECDYLNGKSEYGSKNENSPILNKKTPQEFVMSKVENIHLPTREVCVWSFLALILLLLLLHIHRTTPLHDLSYENSVIGPRV